MMAPEISPRVYSLLRFGAARGKKIDAAIQFTCGTSAKKEELLFISLDVVVRPSLCCPAVCNQQLRVAEQFAPEQSRGRESKGNGIGTD